MIISNILPNRARPDPVYRELVRNRIEIVFKLYPLKKKVTNFDKRIKH